MMKIVINEPDEDQFEKDRVKRIFQVGNIHENPELLEDEK